MDKGPIEWKKGVAQLAIGRKVFVAGIQKVLQSLSCVLINFGEKFALLPNWKGSLIPTQWDEDYYSLQKSLPNASNTEYHYSFILGSKRRRAVGT